MLLNVFFSSFHAVKSRRGSRKQRKRRRLKRPKG